MSTPFFWGVEDLEIDSGLLDSKTLRINRIKAIMPDGLFISSPPPDLDLAPLRAEAERHPLRIYLCVPDESVADRQGVMARFVVRGDSAESDLDPEADESSQSIPIGRLEPNATLVGTEAGTAGRVRLPIAELEFTGAGFKTTKFVPPLLKLKEDDWSRSVYLVCKESSEKIRGKSQYLLGEINSVIENSNKPEFKRQFNQLTAILSSFEIEFSSQESHPYNLYLKLCSLMAHVSAVDIPEEVPRYPNYDHENIYGVFSHVGKTVSQTLDQTLQEIFKPFEFEGSGHKFYIQFQQEWVDCKVVIGALGEQPDKVQVWIEECFIGTDTHTNSMTKNRDVGAKRVRDDRQEGLQRRPGTVLFNLEQDPNTKRRRRIEPGEVLHVYHPDKGVMDPAPQRMWLFIKH